MVKAENLVTHRAQQFFAHPVFVTDFLLLCYRSLVLVLSIKGPTYLPFTSSLIAFASLVTCASLG
ncbi:hypothetical protein K503DRAFT_573053 [Rhizopogon vinicolor AM-OR11-026]|uniref:Uncharacterized protein n=1 Tax=Rhizopogon vinicolor AM-OR11-026 TaxID=1314800 RepID=A0A1B7N7I4_9AGAM|nr:hypothetical protein K503DRAFT_573053 [Rhizopogon vinicolor AM-OR11-026]